MKTGWLVLGVFGVYGGTVTPALLLPWLNQIVGQEPLRIAGALVAWLIATGATSWLGFNKAGY